nr:MAG TPA: hypothetical protein [Caudoviricetes sp.]
MKYLVLIKKFLGEVEVVEVHHELLKKQKS